jgi:CBS domain-containing protein
MKTYLTVTAAPRLTLQAETAAGLMTPNPVTVREDACLREALRLLLDHRISAVPVVDRRGRPVGVLSRSDVLTHDAEVVTHARPAPEYFTRRELARAAGEDLPEGFEVEAVDTTPVREVMTPVVFAVPPDAPAAEVVRQMVALDVHRLFVVGGAGVLQGVITTMDIVRDLAP